MMDKILGLFIILMMSVVCAVLASEFVGWLLNKVALHILNKGIEQGTIVSHSKELIEELNEKLTNEMKTKGLKTLEYEYVIYCDEDMNYFRQRVKDIIRNNKSILEDYISKISEISDWYSKEINSILNNDSIEIKNGIIKKLFKKRISMIEYSEILNELDLSEAIDEPIKINVIRVTNGGKCKYKKQRCISIKQIESLIVELKEENTDYRG